MIRSEPIIQILVWELIILMWCDGHLICQSVFNMSCKIENEWTLLQRNAKSSVYLSDSQMMKVYNPIYLRDAFHEIRMHRLMSHCSDINDYLFVRTVSNTIGIVFPKASGDVMDLFQHQPLWHQENTLFVDLMLVALRATVSMHQKGLYHNDMSMENILYFMDDGKIKFRVCDLGLSQTRDDYLPFFGGKKAYAPPRYKRKFGQDVDAWCCGILFLSIILKSNPWSSLSSLTRELKKLQCKIDELIMFYIVRYNQTKIDNILAFNIVWGLLSTKKGNGTQKMIYTTNFLTSLL
jgi:serine/threonine protein kinase